MSRFTAPALLGGLLMIVASCAAEPPEALTLGTYQAPLLAGNSPNGIYIVVLDVGADPAGAAHAAGAAPAHVYRHALNGFAARLPEAAIAHLRSNPNVLFIQPDNEVSAIGQTLPTGIDRIDVDLSPTAAIDGVHTEIPVDVAVIDTGIDLDHPDLNVAGGVAFAGNTRKLGDDDEGHGSHVAGTIGAMDNGLGVVGVAPGVRLWAVKVLGRDGSGYLSDVLAGVDWVTENADTIEVVNMSLSGPGSDDTDGGDCLDSQDAYHLAICHSVHAGVVYVVAAGNASADAATRQPAAYDEVITVSAMADFDGAPGGAGSATYGFSSCTESEDDSFACFSNYGHDVDIMAPGVGIYSTYLRADYQYSSGTSMASPHVAGAAALYIAEHGRAYDLAGVKAIRQALIDAGDPAPCATPTGQCLDDPDGVQEPLLYVGGPGCETDAECDDGNECTLDACDAGLCVSQPVLDDVPCDGGLGICCGGACAAPTCVDDVGCDDGSACSADLCVNPGTCAAACDNAPLANGAPCAYGECCGGVCCGDLCCDGECLAPGCMDDLDCNDGQACTTDLCVDAGSCGAECLNTWPDCGLADGCCGPLCSAGDDPDCEAACAAPKEYCETGADCCSGSCKRNNTCR